MKRSYLLLYISVAAVLFAACKKEIDNNIRPYNEKSDVELLTNLDGLTLATNGNYALLVTKAASETQYADSWWNMSELKGNNVFASSQAYPNARSDSYTFTNSATQGITSSFWRMSYRIVFGANKVLDAIQDGQGAAFDQLKGENYFLRAMMYFNMVRVYGKPYYQDNGNALAVPLSLSSAVNKDYLPKRNTVKEVYANIISDLEKAANLMTQSRGNYYASREAAWALLSRVYLYMGGTQGAPQNAFNAKASDYADKVINSGKYTLLMGVSYTNFYAIDGKTNKEIVFGFKHDDVNGNRINNYIVPADVFGNPYQGEYAASPDYMAIVTQNPVDIRNTFLIQKTDPRMTTVDKKRYTILKFNYQQIYPPGGFDFTSESRSATPYLRLAEMYLNKAEALSKSGNDNDALTTVNIVRTRAGAPAWTTTSLAVANMSVFDAILNERRLELAWEGHSSFDNFRNGLPLIRNYSDYNGGSLRIEPTDKRVIYPLPLAEIQMNPNLEQNP